MKVMNGLVMTPVEDKWFLCVWLLYYVSNFANSRMKVPRYRTDQVLLYEIIFFSQCIQQQWSGSQYYSYLKLTANCSLLVSGRKERKLWSQPALCRKRLRYHRHLETHHSQCSSPVEALNLIVDSISQPVKLDNSTIELHVPSRRKKSLQSYCSVDFDFFA